MADAGRWAEEVGVEARDEDVRAEEIRAWLIGNIAELAGIPPEEIGVAEPFVDFGLASRHAVLLSGDLELLLGRTLSPTLLYEYPTIAALADYLAQEPRDAGRTTSGREANASEPIAIVGIGCRFPGAGNPIEFWDLLSSGRDAISEVPPDRWDVDEVYDPDPQVAGRAITRWGGFLADVDRFDPFFFGISPGETERMDPQQRLLLELAYEALEDGGQLPERLAGRSVGVFIGISGNEYAYRQLADTAGISGHSGTGNALSIAANRLSYFFDFRGPSLAIDTACSSSLSALHLACRSLRSGESEVALAGGINLMLSPALSIAFTKAGVMAADGRCKAFDARADGYVRGEGAGLIVLKPLTRAVADRDPIYALIRGSAVTQDGRSNGLMAPNREAQETVLREAYRDAAVSPSSVRYVEAHGTGTLLGDPIEAKALAEVLSDASRDDDLVVGSVKTNIGHLEAAAGVAGVIKVALALRHGAIPPSLHYETPNPHIPFEAYRLRVARELEPWSAQNGPSLAGVSSFGFGGTNVHVVLEEAARSSGGPEDPSVALESDPRPAESERIADPWGEVTLPLPISAHSPDALRARLRTLADLLRAGDDSESPESLADICYTSAVRRPHHGVRVAVTGRTRGEIVERLDAAFETPPGLFRPGWDAGPKTVFVFPGQGSQWPGMGRELWRNEPVFRAALEACEEAMRPHVEWSLLSQLAADEKDSRLEEIDVAQPAIFAIQVALADLWRSWGIEPDAVVGHSMGEVAAAYVAGALTLEDAASVICRRSRLMRRLSGRGGMALVELAPERAERFVAGYAGQLSVAARNSPSFTVLSGERAALLDAISALEGEALFGRLVQVDVASHSAQVDTIIDAIREELHGLRPRSPALPIFSTVTGDALNQERLDAQYWVRNLRQPVRFLDAVQKLLEAGHNAFLEISAHPILTSAVRDCLVHLGRDALCLPSLRREEEERTSVLETLCTLYAAGHNPDWEKLIPQTGRVVSLPTYPWQRARYWIEAQTPAVVSPVVSVAGKSGHPLLGSRVDLAGLPDGWVWSRTIDEALVALLAEHRVAGEAVFPAAAFMVLAQEAAARAGLAHTHVPIDLQFSQKLIAEERVPRELQTTLVRKEEAYSLQIHSRPLGRSEWVLHATASLVPSRVDAPSVAASASESPAEIQARCAGRIAGASFYRALADRGIEYGPRFRGLEEVWQGSKEALGGLRLPEELRPEAGRYDLHPALLDACLQVVAAAQNGTVPGTGLLLPVGCRRLYQQQAKGSPAWSHAVVRSTPDSGGLLEADVRVMDAEGHTILEIVGFSLLPTAGVDPAAAPLRNTWLYETAWRHAGPTSGPGRGALEGTSWLVLVDAGEVGRGLADRLRESGARCETLPLAEIDIGVVDMPGSERPLRERLRELLESFGTALDGVVHLWGMDASPTSELTEQRLDEAQAAGCRSFVDLIQAMAGSPRLGTPRLWVATRGAQPAGGGTIAVAQAPVWGLTKSARFELPQLRCTCIDLDPAADGSSNLDSLWTEILEGEPGEDEIAVRDGARLVPRVTAFALPSRPRTEAIVRPDASYLITGGLGGLGLYIARWLADQGCAHLILVGRSAPEATAEKVLHELRERGVNVRVVRADVANATQLMAGLEPLASTMPPMRGVVHAAGLLDDRALLQLDSHRLARVLAPKVRGTWNVHVATAGEELDFFVLFSSAVSVLGSPGQANYAGASAFLDAFAHYRSAQGQPALSINWGPWAEVGLAAAAEERLQRRGADTSHLVKVFRPEEGVRVLNALVGTADPQVMALPFDLTNLIELHPSAAKVPRFSEVVGRDAGHVSRLYARPALRHEYIAPRTEVEQKLAELWRQALHIDRVGVRDSFFELGGDSVLAAQIVTRAQSAFGVEIHLEEAFKALTIEQLAELLEGRLLAKVEALSETEAEGMIAGEATLERDR